MKYTLSVLVENHPGVLSKVSGLFSRRAFNIDSLAVGVTEDPTISRMTIVADGDEYIIEQLEKQLNKVIPVIKVRTYTEGDYISRELSLIKVNSPTNKRLDIMKIAEHRGVFGIESDLSGDHAGKIADIPAVRDIADGFRVFQSFDQQMICLFSVQFHFFSKSLLKIDKNICIFRTLWYNIGIQ